MVLRNVFDWNTAKDNLIVIVRNKVDMRYDADAFPHTEIADLNLYYHVMVGETENRMSTIKVTNSLMKSWGVPLEELHDAAIKNCGRKFPEKLVAMGEAVGIGVDPDNPVTAVLILTNSVITNGASALFYEGVMDCLVENLGADILLLPSSVNEWLIVPDTFGSVYDLQQIVKHVNYASVSANDRLSNSVYKIKNGELIVAESLQ